MDNVEIFEMRECRDEYVAAVNRLLRQLDGESPVFTRSNLETIAGSEASCFFCFRAAGRLWEWQACASMLRPLAEKRG